MPYRITPLVNDSYYHIYNRGVEKRIIFTENHDFERFVKTLYYYLFTGPKPPFSNRFRFKDINNLSQNPKIVEIICYCLMPNHFHLLIKQIKENGVTEFIGKVINSYTKYFNTKHTRVGPLFQGAFKAVTVDDDNQLLHLSRYIHLNPYVSGLVQKSELESYQRSSYPNFIGLNNDQLCNSEFILNFFKDNSGYKNFIEGHEDYAKELEIMKHLLLEDE